MNNSKKVTIISVFSGASAAAAVGLFTNSANAETVCVRNGYTIATAYTGSAACTLNVGGWNYSCTAYATCN